MKNMLYLTKVLFINSFSGMGFGSSKKKEKKSNSILGVIFLFLILGLLVAAPMIFSGYTIGFMFRGLDLYPIFSSLLPIMCVMVLLFSIFGIISTFYLSSDMDTLLSLPFKSKEIILAKFFNSLTSVYLIELMMMTPILLGIGIGSGANFLYYINIILVTIFLPIVPLSIFGILIVSLMRYTALNRLKDKIQYILTAVIVVFAIGIEIFSTSAMGETPEDLGTALSSMDNTLSYILFFTIPASLSLSSSNILISILSILGLIALSIGSVYLFSLVAEKTYIKGVLGKPQIAIKKKNEEIKFKEEKKISVFGEFVKYDLKTIVRSPSYNMNLIIPVFLVPVIFVISFGFGFTEGAEIDMSFSEIIIMLKEMVNVKEGSIFTFVLAGLTFFTSFTMISSSAISREGKQAFFLKTIPVAPITIINSKIFLGVVLGLLPCLLVLIVLLVLGLINLLDSILFLLPLFFFVVLTNYLSIMVDLKKPLLNWENETVAVKQNINSMFQMLIDWGLTIVLIIIGVLLLLFVKLPAVIVSLLLTLILGGSCVIIYKLLKNKGLKIFDKIG